jgi:hypothetical protein
MLATGAISPLFCVRRLCCFLRVTSEAAARVRWQLSNLDGLCPSFPTVHAKNSETVQEVKEDFERIQSGTLKLWE